MSIISQEHMSVWECGRDGKEERVSDEELEAVEEMERESGSWLDMEMESEEEDDQKKEIGDRKEDGVESEDEDDAKHLLTECGGCDWLRVGTLNIRQGFKHKLAQLVDLAEELELDVLALQETGMVQDSSATLSKQGYKLVYSQAEHAGVGLLLRSSIAPLVRAKLADEVDGRLAAVLLEKDGLKLAILSVYMPTDLDNVANDSDEMDLANRLYAKALHFAAPADKVLLMGDLNETRSALDRSSRRDRACAGRAISAVLKSDLVDMWRELHPGAEGYTRCGNIAGSSSFSRLDYILSRGCAASTGDVRCELSSWDKNLSDHRLLVAALKETKGFSRTHTVPTWRKHLPNLRGLTVDKEMDLAMKIAAAFEVKKDWFRNSLANGSRKDLDQVMNYMNQEALRAAF